ncbi:MAG: hypothetical protein GX066_07470 [Clostridiaceae bacterium]|nr:hypothetical protein [Clostridiaceae bacterium]
MFERYHIMPSAASNKSSHKYSNVIYHIMCSSISGVQLFRSDKDKIKYIDLLSKYCKKFQCAVLSYCLMDTHVHIQLDPAVVIYLNLCMGLIFPMPFIITISIIVTDIFAKVGLKARL